MATTQRDVTTENPFSSITIAGEITKGAKRKNSPGQLTRDPKERKVDDWLNIIDPEALISELGYATVFVVYCLEELELDPDDFAVRPLAVLIQHICKCAKTPSAFIANSKIQPRLVGGKQVNPLYISNLRDNFVARNKGLIDRMPGNTKYPNRKLQYACGHLSEVGNLHW